MAESRKEIALSSGWTFKKGGRDTEAEWLPANDLPTEVHLDLLKNEKIADPFKDLNELSVRWIGDEAWTYRTTFTLPPDYGKPGLTTVIKFGGLDTFAHAYINGALLLESSNMFQEHEIEVTGELEIGEQVLEIVFESARQKGLELVKHHKEHRFIVHQTEISRGPVRKAQYDWGWDWGPILMTAGPWKPITIETFRSKILDVWVEYEIDEDLKQVEGKVFVETVGTGRIEVEISKDGQSLEKLDDFQPTKTKNIFNAEFELPDASLWWPRGYGSQPLYTIVASLSSTLQSADSNTVIDEARKTIGFRKVELVQEGDTHGTSFYFRINNVDVFCGGSCWIPADNFLTRPQPSAYRAWIHKAAEGNQTMVRVWGGGIYEPDSFYEAADEFGVLIWQDFMFACANYPANRSYLESVEIEARQNVKRLRNHPSLIIWAGNNEDYQIVERYGLEYNYETDKDPESWLKTNFPARYIYEYLLPKVVKEETKDVPYHPSSPFGNGTSTTLKVDSTVGDIHQWNVWHGTMEPYQRLPRMGGRFVSEFGMEAYPHISTLQKAITRDEDRYPGSMAMDFRNKAIGHERRLISYVAENFRIKYNLECFIHLTQIMQADAITWAYQSWRRDWKQRSNRKCGGVLVWQLNDCWPTMSWAVVDYYGVPKPAYYAIKRTLDPLVVGVQRKVNDWTVRPADELWQRDTSHIEMLKVWQDVQFDVWVASNIRESIVGNVTVKFISVKTGKEVLEPQERAVRIEPNGTTEVFENESVEVPSKQDPNKPFDVSKADPFIIYTSLLVYDKQVATDVSWPEPIKYLDLSERGVHLEYSEDKKKVYVSATKPVKGFVFCEKEGVKLSDNGFDIVPGEKKEVRVEGCAADELEWRYVSV
ncbi:hypothetical protein N0V90_004213 [Kalmusia sp. IMI 367209]|nr:hypothetical protein N0V90_004213 [Kalmusia sp. IMI 367209]